MSIIRFMFYIAYDYNPDKVPGGITAERWNAMKKWYKLNKQYL